MTEFYPPDDNNITGNPLTEARLYAVQALYQVYLLNKDRDAILEEFLTFRIAHDGVDIDKRLFQQLFKAATEDFQRYQTLVGANLSENWTIDRLGLVEKSLLTTAVAELDVRTGTPFKVILNEYINISKTFLNTDDVKFINGALNAIAGKMRPEEVEKSRNKKSG